MAQAHVIFCEYCGKVATHTLSTEGCKFCGGKECEDRPVVYYVCKTCKEEIMNSPSGAMYSVNPLNYEYERT